MALHNYIRRRSHDDIIFAKFDRNPNFIPDDILQFDRNPNFIPDDILPDIVARSGSHENCSLYRMNFICDGIADSLM
jgi:hypothetical protein